MSDENIENNETEQNNKAEKKFAAILNRLTAVVGGKDNLKIPNKTPKDELGNLVQELFKEEREATLLETKEALKGLLKKYAELERTLDTERKKLEKVAKEKKAEFVKAAEEVFKKIEDVGDVEKTYYSALKITSEGSEYKSA